MSIRVPGTEFRPAPAAFSGRYSDVDHFMTRDGMQMFFCSYRPVEPGAESRPDADIWISTRSDGVWGEAQHLGTTVNSQENDDYPTLAADGTLYFSSHREGGLGGNDIYCSSFVDGSFTQPDAELGRTRAGRGRVAEVLGCLGITTTNFASDATPFFSGFENRKHPAHGAIGATAGDVVSGEVNRTNRTKPGRD